MAYYVYILASDRNGTPYVGVTNDLLRRVYEHKEGVAEDFTKRHGVKRLERSSVRWNHSDGAPLRQDQAWARRAYPEIWSSGQAQRLAQRRPSRRASAWRAPAGAARLTDAPGIAPMAPRARAEPAVRLARRKQNCFHLTEECSRRRKTREAYTKGHLTNELPFSISYADDGLAARAVCQPGGKSLRHLRDFSTRHTSSGVCAGPGCCGSVWVA